jgi:hypothetical protein
MGELIKEAVEGRGSRKKGTENQGVWDGNINSSYGICT